MSLVSVFTDQENVEVRGIAAKNASRNEDVSGNVKLKSKKRETPTMLSRSEKRLALGDVSNSCARPTGNCTDSIKKSKRVESNKWGGSPTPRKLLLPFLIANHPSTAPAVAELNDEGFQDDVEAMPPNDEEYPDNFEDVWPIAERPTREHLQWLTKFYFTIGGERDDSPLSLVDEENDLLDDELSDISTLKLLEPHFEMVPEKYELEQAEELPFDDLMDDSLIFL